MKSVNGEICESVGQGDLLDDGGLLTVQEVAKILNVPESWIYGAVRGRHGNKLPHVRIGRYVRFELKAVQEFITRQKHGYRAGNGSVIMEPLERRGQ